MTIQSMVDLALRKGRAEYEDYLVTVEGAVLSVYRSGQLRLMMDGSTVTAYQAWTRNDATLLNAVFSHLGLHDQLHCTWSENGPHLIEYDTTGEVLHAETPTELIRRLHDVVTA